MSKPVDFGASATLIQAWYRQRATRKLLRIVQARFDSLERSICQEIQARFPCYQHSNNQDYLQSYPPWPLFTMSTLDYLPVFAPTEPKEAPALNNRANNTAETKQGTSSAAPAHLSEAPVVEVTSTRKADRSILEKRLSELEVERILLEQAILDRIRVIESERLMHAVK